MKRIATAIQDTCDFYCGRVYYGAVCVLMSMLVFYTAREGHRLSVDWEQWMIGEWLISYASGFVRRGLSGELLLFINHYSGVPANLIVFGAFFLLFASFCIVLAVLLRKKQITFWYFFLCLSPGFLLFTFYNNAAIGRKELLIFVAFALWAHFLAERRDSRLLYVLFGALSALLTLMHEMFFFFTPYFVLLAYLRSQDGRGGRDWKMSLGVPASSFLALLLIVLFSGTLNDPALCDRLTAIGAPAKVCDGILSFGDAAPTDVLRDFIGHFELHTLLGLVLLFPLILVPVYLFLSANGGDAQPIWKFMCVCCALILFSSPLFVLAVDWGRWISIHIVLLTITCSLFLRNTDRGWRAGLSSPPKTKDERPETDLRPAHLILGLLILSSTLCWSLTYCCGSSFFHVLGPITVLNGVR